jgi:hypothetical protein
MFVIQKWNNSSGAIIPKNLWSTGTRSKEHRRSQAFGLEAARKGGAIGEFDYHLVALILVVVDAQNLDCLPHQFGTFKESVCHCNLPKIYVWPYCVSY